MDLKKYKLENILIIIGTSLYLIGFKDLGMIFIIIFLAIEFIRSNEKIKFLLTMVLFLFVLLIFLFIQKNYHFNFK